MTPLYGGIEGGGTKFICVVGSGPGDIRAETRFPTTTPEETLGQAIDFFQQQRQCTGGWRRSVWPALGRWTPTRPRRATAASSRRPSPAGPGADVVSALEEAFGVPVGFDTDVNGAALAEWRWGAAQGCDPVLYLTIGTGIGGGALVNGQAAARADPPGDGAHSHPARPPARSLPRRLSLPWRLL